MPTKQYAIGQAGMGIFYLPSIIEKEVCDMFKVKIIGRTTEVKQVFYAISAERKVKHPAIAAFYEIAKKRCLS